MNIITITLNPAFDIHCEIESFELYRENYAKDVIKQSGGKGINISRALKSYGVENTAFVILGSDGSEEFKKSLEKDRIIYNEITAEGRIRENITVHSKEKETRISFEGFKLSSGVMLLLLDKLLPECGKNTLVTFTGRLPEGILKSDAAEFLKKIENTGAKLIVDCNSFTKEELFKIRPYLIKPNEEEIARLCGKSAENAAEELFLGGIENVIVSLGGEGFLYSGENGSFKVSVPKISPVSTIGAGDSTLAGFIAGIADGKCFEECLKLAAAFGTAACLEEGTNPPEKEKILKILNEVICEKL